MAKPIRVDFTGSGNPSWTPGEEYNFTVDDLEAKTSSTGNPMLKFTFKHLDSNRKAWLQRSLQPQSLWVLKKDLVAIGVDQDDLEGEFEINPDDILGQKVKIVFGEPEQSTDGKTYQNPVELRPY